MYKRILFIGLPYHLYINAMIKEMEKLGYAVDFYPVKLRSSKLKALRYISPSYYKKITRNHHEKVVEQAHNIKYDYVLFLQVHTFDYDLFLQLKENHSESKFVFYSWDAESPTLPYQPYLPHFDAAYTFDSNDAKRFNINYLPLFAMREYQVMSNKNYTTDVYTIGNLVKPQRYIAITAFREYCRNNGISYNTHIKCTPAVYYKFILKGIFAKNIKFKDISYDNMLNMIESSKATFDFANHVQTGYTMRLMENLCAGKKIITNNKRVLEEPFYSDDRFFVFSDLNFEGIKEFLEKPIKEDKKFEQYYVQNFVKTLLS